MKYNINEISNYISSIQLKNYLSDEVFRSFLKENLSIDLIIDLKLQAAPFFYLILKDSEFFRELIFNENYQIVSIVDIVETRIFQEVYDDSTIYEFFFKEVYPTLTKNGISNFPNNITPITLLYFLKNHAQYFPYVEFDLEKFCLDNSQNIEKIAHLLKEYSSFNKLVNYCELKKFDQETLLKKVMLGEISSLIKNTNQIPDLISRIIFYFNEPLYEKLNLARTSRIQAEDIEPVKFNLAGFMLWMKETPVELFKFAKAMNLPLDQAVDMSAFKENDFYGNDYALLLNKNINISLHLLKHYLNYLSNTTLNKYFISDKLIKIILQICETYLTIDWTFEHKNLKELIVLGVDPESFIKLSHHFPLFVEPLRKNDIEIIVSKFKKNKALEVEKICLIYNPKILIQLISFSEEVAFDLIHYKPSLLDYFNKPYSSYIYDNFRFSYHEDINVALGKVFLAKYYLKNKDGMWYCTLKNDNNVCNIFGKFYFKSLKRENYSIDTIIKAFKCFNVTDNVCEGTDSYLMNFIKRHFEELPPTLPSFEHPYRNIQLETISIILLDTIKLLMNKHNFLKIKIPRDLKLYDLLTLLEEFNTKLENFYSETASTAHFSM